MDPKANPYSVHIHKTRVFEKRFFGQNNARIYKKDNKKHGNKIKES